MHGENENESGPEHESSEEMPTTDELQQPSTEKEPGDEPQAPADDTEPSHEAVGIGVIGRPQVEGGEDA